MNEKVLKTTIEKNIFPVLKELQLTLKKNVDKLL